MTIEQAEAAVAAAQAAFDDAKAGLDTAWAVWHQKHDELFQAKHDLSDAKRANR